MTTVTNPCLSCGACCAFYRASFYWGETDASPWGTVPVDMTENLTPFLQVMKGTNQKQPRCVALAGEIGTCVTCTIYDRRSSVCRDFPFSWQDGQPNPRCDQARAAWGLPALPAPPGNAPEAVLSDVLVPEAV